jgi:Cu/Ag efflux protein CusF
MKRVIVLLIGVFLLAGLAAAGTVAQEKQEKEKTAASVKQARWHGVITRVSMDESYMDVHRANVDKRIYFDSSTKWTEGKKQAEMSKFKEGADVICLGQYNEKKEFHATRIDLRKE